MATLDETLGLLRAHGLRVTPQRRAIVARILGTRGHIAPTALVAAVQADLPGVNPSTIYRTLAVLEEAGVLAHAHLEGGPEYHRTEDAGHVHLTCSTCGRSEDLSAEETEDLAGQLERAHGFRPDLTHFAISGTCARCRGTRRPAGTSR